MQQMACHGGRIAPASSSSSSFPSALTFQMPPQCQNGGGGHLLPPPFPAANALIASNLPDLAAAVPLLIPAKLSVSFPGTEAGGDDDDLSDDEGSLAGGEKKKRLSVEQVRALERSFELGNKLEPERKTQLARALGLRPRQVAIWFQNRRARWKTKQLERDFDALKKQLDVMRSENESLHAHNRKLQSQILALRGREASEILINLNRETEGSCSNKSDNSSEINLDMSRTPPPPPPAAIESSQIMPYFQTIKSADELQIGHLLHCSNPKIDSSDVSVLGTFSNLLCGISGDQPALWPWPNHHHHLPQHHHHGNLN